MFPRGNPSLTDLHRDSLLNLVIKDKMLAVTIFDRHEGAETTEKGRKYTQDLSMDSGFRKDATDSDDGAEAEANDLDLSCDEEIKLVKVMPSPRPSSHESVALSEAKKLISEVPLDPEVLSAQEAVHLNILMAAAKAADIRAEGSFVPPAIVTNLLKIYQCFGRGCGSFQQSTISIGLST